MDGLFFKKQNYIKKLDFSLRFNKRNYIKYIYLTYWYVFFEYPFCCPFLVTKRFNGFE